MAMLVAVLGPLNALAQTSTPFTVYDNELKPGWENWSWAKVDTRATAGEVKPLKVQGDAWSALALHHDAFSTAPYSKLTFYLTSSSLSH
jgi:hypothetical protein